MISKLKQKFDKLEKKVLNNEKFFETLLLWPFATYTVVYLYDKIPVSSANDSVFSKVGVLINILIFENFKDKTAAILMVSSAFITLIILIERASVNAQSKLEANSYIGKKVNKWLFSKLKQYQSIIYEIIFIYYTLNPDFSSYNLFFLYLTSITTAFLFRKAMRFILIKVKNDKNIKSQNKIVQIISILSYGFLLIKFFK